MGKTIRSDKFDMYGEYPDYGSRRDSKEAQQRDRQAEGRLVRRDKHAAFL